MSGLYDILESVVLIGSQDTDSCQFDEADEFYLLNLLILKFECQISMLYHSLCLIFQLIHLKLKHHQLFVGFMQISYLQQIFRYLDMLFVDACCMFYRSVIVHVFLHWMTSCTLPNNLYADFIHHILIDTFLLSVSCNSFLKLPSSIVYLSVAYVSVLVSKIQQYPLFSTASLRNLILSLRWSSQLVEQTTMQRQSLELTAIQREKHTATSKRLRTKALAMRSSIRMICGININNRSILFTRKNLIYIYKTKNMIKFSENNLSSTFLRSLVKDQLLEQYLNIQSQMSGETIINTNRHSHFTSMMCTHSQHDSNHDSRQASISRKMSASMSKKQLDMDKLIGDVKITPAKNNKYSQCITNIRHQLQGLKDLPQILDQVKTIQLLLNSLSKKVQLEGQGSVSNASHQRSSSKLSHQRLGSISPIKQFEDINSHIVYTNFSIKGIGNGNGNWQDGQSTRRSVAEIQQLQTPIKRALFDESQNNEIERINSEIKVLEKILQSKGINQRISQRQHLGTHDTNSKDNIRTSGNKAKYMQSENLCPLFRKNTHQSSQQKNGFILLQGKNNKIPGANLR